MDQNLVVLSDVYKHYNNPGNNLKLEVLKGINLKVRKGETIAIIGPSGSGKSTILNIIGTLDKASGGNVNLFGNEINEYNDNEISNIRNKEIGFIFQFHHLLPHFTVLENVLIPTIPYKKKDNNVIDRALKLLDKVSLKDRLNHKPSQLSGGECQRVAVIRALINKPKIILADEPTGSLDEKNTDNLIDMLINLNKDEDISLITVTHSNKLANKMNNVYELSDGVLT